MTAREDHYSNDEAGAAHYAAIIGQSEHIADRTFVEVRRACFVCQNATRSNFVCGPCRRVIDNGIDQAGGYTDDQRARMRVVVALDAEEQAVKEQRDAEWWEGDAS